MLVNGYCCPGSDSPGTADFFASLVVIAPIVMAVMVIVRHGRQAQHHTRAAERRSGDVAGDIHLATGVFTEPKHGQVRRVAGGDEELTNRAQVAVAAVGVEVEQAAIVVRPAGQIEQA